MLAVTVNVPVAGSYISALISPPQLEGGGQSPDFVLSSGPKPPAIRTLPSGSRVALCALRALVKLRVGANAPVAGSYISALEVK